MLVWVISGPSAVSAQEQAGWNRQDDRLAYGADDYLYSGAPYAPEHQGAAGHPFLDVSDWQRGSVFLRDISFPDQELKFNIETQQLIIWHKPEGRPPVQLVLPAHLVDSFTIEEQSFVHNRNLGVRENGLEFLEPVYSGSFVVCRSVHKQFIANYNAAHPRGFFSQTTYRYFLSTNGEWKEFSSARALLKQFPDQKREVRRLRRQEDIPRKFPTATQLSFLLHLCDE